MRAWSIVRILLEALGVGFAGVVAFFGTLVVLQVGARPIGVLLLGWAAFALLVVLLRSRSGVTFGRRALVDGGLAALVPAAWLTLAAIEARWPLRGRSVDAHGWGLSGGEPNVQLLSWLHGFFWVVLLLLGSRLGARTQARAHV